MTALLINVPECSVQQLQYQEVSSGHITTKTSDLWWQKFIIIKEEFSVMYTNYWESSGCIEAYFVKTSELHKSYNSGVMLTVLVIKFSDATFSLWREVLAFW